MHTRTNTQATTSEVTIRVNEVELDGQLVLPADTKGIVLFAHGSGSSRHSPRNQFVARVLHDAGVGTLLFDLLTADEEQVDARTAHLRFDISLLATRLVAATQWLKRQPTTRSLAIGYFGSSTGAAAALVAAAEVGESIRSVVSRGGRPDLAGPALPKVKAATLLIVGGSDTLVIELNQAAYTQMRCEKAVEVIPGATHLFEETGALERVADLASDWFAEHFQSRVSQSV